MVDIARKKSPTCKAWVLKSEWMKEPNCVVWKWVYNSSSLTILLTPCIPLSLSKYKQTGNTHMNKIMFDHHHPMLSFPSLRTFSHSNKCQLQQNSNSKRKKKENRRRKKNIDIKQRINF